MASVSIVFRKDRINKDGEAPINFFVIKDRKLTKVATGLMVHSKYWDDANKRVKSSHKNSGRLNAFLLNKFAELNDKVLENETEFKSLTTRQLKENIYGKKPTDFFKFADEAIKDYEKQGKIGTHDRCKAVVEKLKTYVEQRNISFQEITPEFLTKYERHLRDKRKNKTNSIHANLKFFRKLFNDAVRLDIIDPKHNPFLKYKLKTEKTQRIFLTEYELSSIALAECTPGTRKELHRDMFVFAAYVGGLRVSDVLLLKWKHITDTHVNFTVRKTGSQLSIKITNTAKSILDKYKPKKLNPNSYVFSMLPDNLDEKDLRRVDSEISNATAHINKNLKLIEEDIELTKHISFHISRHTFATRALRKGISIDKVSKLMGHAAIRETQVYAKIVNEELDKAMDLLEEPKAQYRLKSA